MKRMLVGLGLSLLASFSVQAENSPGGVSIGVRASTLGVGLEANKAYGEHLNFRLAYHYFETSEEVNDGSTLYTGDLELSNGGLFTDWHPWTSGFRLTGGVMLNNNEVTLQAKPQAATIDIGGTQYNISGGRLDGRIDFDTVAPYLGLGWGRAVARSSRWGFLIDLGVMFQGSPNVELTPSGTITAGGVVVPINSPQLTQSIQNEINTVKSDVEDFDLYPVLSLGLTYRF